MNDSGIDSVINSKINLINETFKEEIEVLRERFKGNSNIEEVDMVNLFKVHHKTTPNNFFFFTNFKKDQFVAKPWIDRNANKSYWLVYFGENVEGPPKMVHGGAIATALDQIVGLTSIFFRGPCVTGELVVKYQKFVKTCNVYFCEVSIEKEEGRALYLVGDLKDFKQAFEEDSPPNSIAKLVMIKLTPQSKL